MSKFGDNLKRLRGEESQAQFAKRLGIQQVTYGRYELGTREPDLDTLCRIGLVTGTSIDELLGVTPAKIDISTRKYDALKGALETILREY